MNVEFASISRKNSLAKEIADTIYDAVMTGKLRPGVKLPGQRTLAQQFGASTTTVREAMSMLSAMDVVEMRHGQGTIVRDRSEVRSNFKGWLGVTLNREDIEDFLEARYFLESFTLEKVIRTVRPEQMVTLEAAHREMEMALDDPEAYPEKDIAFHRKLTETAGNKVLTAMAEAIYSRMREQIGKSMIRHLKADNLRESCERHRDLLECIRKKDLPGALALVHELLDYSRRSNT